MRYPAARLRKGKPQIKSGGRARTTVALWPDTWNSNVRAATVGVAEVVQRPCCRVKPGQPAHRSRCVDKCERVSRASWTWAGSAEAGSADWCASGCSEDSTKMKESSSRCAITSCCTASAEKPLEVSLSACSMAIGLSAHRPADALQYPGMRRHAPLSSRRATPQETHVARRSDAPPARAFPPPCPPPARAPDQGPRCPHRSSMTTKSAGPRRAVAYPARLAAQPPSPRPAADSQVSGSGGGPRRLSGLFPGDGAPALPKRTGWDGGGT